MAKLQDELESATNKIVQEGIRELAEVMAQAEARARP